LRKFLKRKGNLLFLVVKGEEVWIWGGIRIPGLAESGKNGALAMEAQKDASGS